MIYKGKPNTGELVMFIIMKKPFSKSRKQSARDKARMKRKQKFKMISQTIVVKPMVLATVTLIGLYTIGIQD